MSEPDLSLNEWVVLGLLAEEPTHGFAVSRQLAKGSDLGRILTVHRPLVYRAIDRLVSADLVEPVRREPGDKGPDRTLYRPTGVGRARLQAWLGEPVLHVRDLRIAFLVKLRLLERSGRATDELVGAQRAALHDTLRGLGDAPDDGDAVDLWRSHNARAARAFLDQLAGRTPPPGD